MKVEGKVDISGQEESLEVELTLSVAERRCGAVDGEVPLRGTAPPQA